MAWGIKYIGSPEVEAAFRQDPEVTTMAYAAELMDQDVSRNLAYDLAEAAHQEAVYDPALDEQYDVWQQDQEMQEYDRQVARIAADNPGLNVDLFHGFLAGAHGDMDLAQENYWRKEGERQAEAVSLLGVTAEDIAHKQNVNRAVDATPLPRGDSLSSARNRRQR